MVRSLLQVRNSSQDGQRVANRSRRTGAGARGRFRSLALERLEERRLLAAEPSVKGAEMAAVMREAAESFFDMEMEITGTWQSVISGLFPIAQIDKLAALDHVRSVRPFAGSTSVGLAMSQGAVAQRSDDLRTALGVDGSGVTVGVLSDSFNNLGGWAADVAAGDLPGTANPWGYTTLVAKGAIQIFVLCHSADFDTFSFVIASSSVSWGCGLVESKQREGDGHGQDPARTVDRSC